MRGRRTDNGRTLNSGIKVLTVEDLERLTEAAFSHPLWSATGRPAWLRENRNAVDKVMAIFFDFQSKDARRCQIMVTMKDKAKWRFTLDMSKDDFQRLPDAPADLVFTLARARLHSYPHRALDPDQQAEWDRIEGRTGDRTRDSASEPDGEVG